MINYLWVAPAVASASVYGLLARLCWIISGIELDKDGIDKTLWAIRWRRVLLCAFWLPGLIDYWTRKALWRRQNGL